MLVQERLTRCLFFRLFLRNTVTDTANYAPVIHCRITGYARLCMPETIFIQASIHLCMVIHIVRQLSASRIWMDILDIHHPAYRGYIVCAQMA